MLMKVRYGTDSTVFCTQIKKKDWHPRLGGEVHTEAIMGMIMHNAVWVDMDEANMRQRRGYRPVTIKRHRDHRRPRCPSAIMAASIRDI